MSIVSHKILIRFQPYRSLHHLIKSRMFTIVMVGANKIYKGHKHFQKYFYAKLKMLIYEIK